MIKEKIVNEWNNDGFRFGGRETNTNECDEIDAQVYYGIHQLIAWVKSNGKVQNIIYMLDLITWIGVELKLMTEEY